MLNSDVYAQVLKLSGWRDIPYHITHFKTIYYINYSMLAALQTLSSDGVQV